MAGKLTNEYGSINIDESVIETIAGLAAIESYGLVGMSSRNATDGLVELLKKEHVKKGVKVYTDGDRIVVDLFVVVQFGTKISVVADNIIDKVKYNIESMTGLKVEKVNINVQGVRVQK
ncbi:Asp23/Gls24 family envelope stress response protein [Proteiniborus sp. MB09-C3]|uniref:Asp23/Gls24 family envelope stress response protein n=1 Tax=Proteiniborus sp. MB09-C3 TaxID=3050072 RepID=UPI002556F7E6|nr:Asp23/Gls24 family envelope stress response protein [Proteiniborus sp. MB09-C3]WIV10813.1 Asp23/Gls24 family envelope stress response protein [Proteiniborus sp. MB09-C3]